jgi:hypothetical protein
MLIEEKLGYALTGSSAEFHDQRVVDAGKKKIVKSFVQRGLIGHGPSFFGNRSHFADDAFRFFDVLARITTQRVGDSRSFQNAAGELSVLV